MPLNVRSVIDQVNSQIDDKLPDDQIINWINDALAKIATASNVIFPELDTINVYATFPIPDRWVRLLIIPFASGRAKQQDSSQFEYSEAYSQFFSDISTFTEQYQMPDDYKVLAINQDLTKPDGTTYTTANEDTLSSLAKAWSSTVQAIKDANATITIQFVTDEFEGDVYSDPAFPWMTAF